MDAPFRSQAEQLTEQIRRADEREAQLREKEAELEAHIALSGRKRPYVVVLVSAVACVLLIVFAVSAVIDDRTIGHCRHEVWVANDNRIAESNRLHASEVARTQAENALQACRSEVKALRMVDAWPRPTACGCQLGDPLCSCIDDIPNIPFDRLGAEAALEEQQAALSDCLDPKRDAAVQVTAEFMPTGRLVTQRIWSVPALANRETSCMAGVLRRTKIPPYTGGTVFLQKTFTFDTL